MKKIMIVAGEVSGDLHASHLAKALFKIQPDLEIFAVGGEKLQAAGATLLYNIIQRSTIGFIEFFKHLPFYLWLMQKLKNFLTKNKPDLIILVDFQGFNMLLAEKAKKLGIKTLYYIAPQDWLWGTEKSILNVVNTLDELIAIFEDEYNVYKKHTKHVHYFGHPLLDIVNPTKSKKETIQKYNLNPNKKTLAIFPGSRQQEIKRVFPAILETTQNIHKKEPENYQFIVNLPDTQYKKQIVKKFDKLGIPFTLAINDTYNVLKLADFMLATSGTISLEATIAKTPMTVLYKLHPISYRFAKNVLKLNIPYIALPNLIMKKEVVKEYLQGDVIPENIAEYITETIQDKKKYNKLIENLEEVIYKLGKKGTIKKTAELILKKE
jgi:lipid-A-disaccharide synthase